ncbi:MAG TPA: CHASE3 domain-containing protein [Terriglobales bacterium]|nr:CHASE3 domain-containing protein [Terriglobales bacterium]
MTRTVERTVLTGFVIVLALLGTVGVVSQRTILGLIEDTRWVNHSHEVLELLQRVSFEVTQAEASVRGFVITGNSTLESQYLSNKGNVQPVISELRAKTSDNPVEQANVDQIQSLIAERFAILDNGIHTRKAGGLQAILAQSGNNRGLIVSANISSLIGKMRDEEKRLLAERSNRARQSARRAFLVVLTSVLVAMAAVLACLFLAFRDLTRRRQISRMKSEFVSVVSHELRTPLTSIHGSLGLLASGLLGSQKGKRMLEIAASNTDRLIRLINDILDVEKLDSGEVEMHRTVCSASDLMSRAADVMRPMAEEHRTTLVTGQSDKLIQADADRILQCLTNLLSNAIKFSDPGGTISMNATVMGAYLRFAVSDHGRGIPADMHVSIFERFHQVDASDSRRKGGTGLGLAITRSIVQQHGGAIWVESEVGKGSTFFFTIPLATVAAKAVERPPAAEVQSVNKS